jgi:hypothetical protein
LPAVGVQALSTRRCSCDVFWALLAIGLLGERMRNKIQIELEPEIVRGGTE